MSALSGGGRIVRPRLGLPSLVASSSSTSTNTNFAQYGFFSTASAGAEGEKLKDITDLPGPSVEAFFARAMKNNFYDFHVITAELCDQYGDRGLLQYLLSLALILFFVIFVNRHLHRLSRSSY